MEVTVRCEANLLFHFSPMISPRRNNEVRSCKCTKYTWKNSTKYNFVLDNFMAVSLAHWSHTLSIIKMLVCTCAMHMSSIDTSSIIVHHGTVQYSRRIPISRNLKFFEITDNSNPRRGGRGGGVLWGGGYPYFKWQGWSKVLKFSFAGFFWLEKFGKYFFGVAWLK